MVRLIKYGMSFTYCCFLKLKYGSRLKVNPLRVYISILSEIKITGNGSINIDTSNGRVYISRYSSIISSGGNISIGSGVFFNKGNNIVSHKSIRIGENCLFGHNICCFDSDHNYEDVSVDIRFQGYTKQEIRIERNVWICAGVIITKGTTIGQHSVIAANSVVRNEIGEYSVCAGIPCKLIKKIQ